MRLGKTVSVEELQIVSRFEGLRKMLLSETYADHLDKPLAYWALPTDRRLPLAFLGARCAICWARRLSNCRPRRASGGRRSPRSSSCWPAPPTPIPPNCPPKSSIRSPTAQRPVDGDPADQRRLRSDQHLRGDVGAVAGSVVRHGLTGETLGRFAPSLQNMTRVIWNTPLGAYTSSTLAEIRAMKTHGEKRIRALLEVFHAVHTIVAGMGTQEHLVVRIVPRSDRSGRAVDRPGVAAAGHSQRSRKSSPTSFDPLLGTGPHRRHAADRHAGREPAGHRRPDHQRAAGRAHHGAHPRPRLPTPQRDQRHHDGPLADRPAPVHELREKFQAEAAELDESPDLHQFYAAVELFYPGSRRGAAGPLEQVARSGRAGRRTARSVVGGTSAAVTSGACSRLASNGAKSQPTDVPATSTARGCSAVTTCTQAPTRKARARSWPAGGSLTSTMRSAADNDGAKCVPSSLNTQTHHLAAGWPPSRRGPRPAVPA